MVFGIAGILASRQLQRVAAFNVILSSGTVLAAIGLGPGTMIAPALFYLLGSVLASGALFLLTGMTERMRTMTPETANSPSAQPVTYSAFKVGEPPDPHPPDAEVGVAIPSAMAFLGLAFVCCALLVTGMPPLAGFIGKLALLSGAFATLSSERRYATGLATHLCVARRGIRRTARDEPHRHATVLERDRPHDTAPAPH